MANKTSIRVELVDNWHAYWPAVLEAIASCGQLEALSIDADGWLSARQVLLVAFARDKSVAGHLCFQLVLAADLQGNVEMEGILKRLE